MGLFGVLVVMVGCSSSGGSATGHATTSVSPTGALTRLPLLVCADSIATAAAPPKDTRVVLGVVALPTSTRQATSAGSESSEVFAKTPLYVHAGTRFKLSLSPPGQLATMAWGKPGTRTESLQVPGCESGAPDQPWLVYPGGYWATKLGCVHVIVDTNDGQEKVPIGVGAPCPRQLPAPSPN